MPKVLSALGSMAASRSDSLFTLRRQRKYERKVIDVVA